MSLANKLSAVRNAAHMIPSPSEQEIILSLVSEGDPYSSLFFSEIEDPAWIPVLESRDFFRSIPDPISHEDGSVSYPRSLALLGLERLATKSPEAAVRIIAELPPSKNVAVGDQIMRCMLAIREPLHVPKLVPYATTLVSEGSRSSRLFLRDLLKNWVDLGCTDEALQLLATFIETIVRAGTKARNDQQIAWELAECDTYILAPMVSKSPGEVADICFKSLCTYYDAADPNKDELSELIGDVLEPAKYDVRNDTYWLEEFRQVGLYHDDARAILAHRLHAALIPIYQGAPTVRDKYDQELLSHPWHLFIRLRCQLYADAPAQTLNFARRETLAALDCFNRAEYRHKFEFASMLEAHSKLHGNNFLTKEEVDTFIQKVMEGPLNEKDQLDPDEKYQHYFRRQQLWPIRALLSDDVQHQLEGWVERESGKQRSPDLEDYKPIRFSSRSGSVIDTSPFSLDELAAYSDDQLWHQLNFWKQTKKWIEDEDLIEESSRELATTFTKLIAKQPDRFLAKTKWWQNIQRPIILAMPLETWAIAYCPDNAQDTDLQSPVDPELAFGLMGYIISMSQDCISHEGASDDSSEKPDWSRARLAAVHFLNGFIRANPPHNQWSPEVKSLLRVLATGAETRLDNLDHSIHQDWQFEAINSVRGETWDAILHLALKEKNYPEQATGAVSAWIADLLSERLNPATSESPAIYSLLGSKLRILVYVLPDWIRGHKNLLFPKDRVACLEAITDGHLAYDQPHKFVADVLPEVLSIALDVAESRIDSNEQQVGEAINNTRDVSSRLGFHICFYYWNDWFADPQLSKRYFDRFLSVVPTLARAETLSYIGKAFEKTEPSPDVQALIDRAQSLLNYWLEHVKREAEMKPTKAGWFDYELGQFADLIAAECFPFDWRVEVASTALGLITRPRWSFQLLDTLEKWSEEGEALPERIKAGIHLLTALTEELSDELRWSIQVKQLTPILSMGLNHANEEVRAQTKQVIDNLLQHGFFDLLDLVDTTSE